MARLEDLTPGTQVRGVLPDRTVTVVQTVWHGDSVIELTHKDASGRVAVDLLYRDREPYLEVVTAGRRWSLDGDGALFRLAAEAHRIGLAHLFDPLVAVHASLVEPLPHQITAVYEEMLPRQPLRYLLADDPGAGKTIMTGLLIKELRIRGDIQRCLIVCPGALVEQWQDELSRRFGLGFEILTNDKLESARTGNWFQENALCIARLDKLSRDDDVQAKLMQTDWDLIVCDEAHKMSAHFFSGEASFTRRYKLGQLLGGLTRHFLLLTATPHNGKEEDFQLFMALLDGDRFEGRFRDGVHTSDTSDLMRRLVKEDLVKFDGTPLFPERIAYAVNYRLSPDEAGLYAAVTEYVREQFNRADALQNDGRRGTVGFALTTLQRRLASSPEAIYQSLRRRRERLERRLREEQLLKRGADTGIDLTFGLPSLTDEALDDLDDAPDAEVEETEEQVVDQASAARTIAELGIEIGILQHIEAMALRLRNSTTDRKWEQLRDLLQNNAEMFDATGHRRKLVIFTEHRDTLTYLVMRIRALFGRDEAVVQIHGGMGREERRKAQEAFTQDKSTEVLVATDAAGEGINLQRAHLMVNYDLPWNPNRLEQRFGRIHRIGQTEVCHLWNLVAGETREGEVYQTLLTKLAQEREALGGQVFDVLGKLTFDDQPLRDLLLQAIRYGDRPDVRARLHEVVDRALDREHLRGLLDERALAHDSLGSARVQAIREQMERAQARRLQPHYVASFFLEAFRQLSGTVREREPGRYEILNVPGVIRSRDRQIGLGEAVLHRYERITFERDLVALPGRPPAALICPGHPLLDATVDLVRERHGQLLRRGALLVDPADPGDAPRLLFFLEHAIQDARQDRHGNRRIVSRRVQFAEAWEDGAIRAAGSAPYLDYRPPTPAEAELSAPLRDLPWLRADLERQALGYAISALVPEHLQEVRGRNERRIDLTAAAVRDRLTKEITHWYHRAMTLRAQEQAGRTPRMNSIVAERRADELQARLQHRLEELEQERHLSPQPPVLIGCALVVPAGWLARRLEGAPPDTAATAEDRRRVELLAMAAVMQRERALGHTPADVSADRRGYDIESRDGADGRLRFIEVKGRTAGADTITVTRNEVLTALNKPEEFILALVEVSGDRAAPPRYLRRPFHQEPEFGVTAQTHALAELLSRAEALP